MVKKKVAQPPAEDVFARARALPKLNISGAEIIRQVRAERDRELARRLGLGKRRKPR